IVAPGRSADRRAFDVGARQSGVFRHRHFPVRPLDFPAPIPFRTLGELMRNRFPRRYLAMSLVLAASVYGAKAFADDLDSLSHDDKQWVMPAKDYANTRFSGLNQINA